MEKVYIWYSISNCGDGSAYADFCLTEEAAEEHQERMYEGWSESCIGRIETFVGSESYVEAKRNEKEWRAEWAEKDNGKICIYCDETCDDLIKGVCKDCRDDLDE